MNNNHTLMETLVEHYPDNDLPNLASSDDHTALSLVIQKGEISNHTFSTVKLLVILGSDLNMVHTQGQTVLCMAIRRGWLSMAKWLLSKGSVWGSRWRTSPMYVNRLGLATANLITRGGKAAAEAYMGGDFRTRYSRIILVLPEDIITRIMTFIMY
jgi:hypothetical protein